MSLQRYFWVLGPLFLALAACGGNLQAPDVEVFSASAQTGKAPLSVTFTFKGKGSAGLSCALDFGDGANAGSTPCSAQGQVVHSYTTASVFSAKLTVTDASGLTASAQLQINTSGESGNGTGNGNGNGTGTGTNHAPTIVKFMADRTTTTVGGTINLTVQGADQDDDALTCTLTYNNHLVNFPNNAESVDCRTVSTAPIQASGVTSGPITLTVKDPSNAVVTQSINISFTGTGTGGGTNRAPVIQSFDKSLDGTLTWNVTDPDGDAVTCVLRWGPMATENQETVPCANGSRKLTKTGTGFWETHLTATDSKGATAQLDGPDIF